MTSQSNGCFQRRLEAGRRGRSRSSSSSRRGRGLRCLLVGVALVAAACSGEPGPVGPVVDAEPYGAVGAREQRTKLDGSQQSYRELLERVIADAEQRLGETQPGTTQRALQDARLMAARDRLGRIQLAYLDYRERLAEATSSLKEFLDRYSPQRNWELGYALESGDLGLAVSVVEETLDRAVGGEQRSLRPTSKAEARFAEGAARKSTVSPEAEETMRRDASAVLLRLGRVAAERLEFGAAERSFRLAIDQSTDLGARAAAIQAYADLLAGTGRLDQSRELTTEIDRLLRQP